MTRYLFSITIILLLNPCFPALADFTDTLPPLKKETIPSPSRPQKLETLPQLPSPSVPVPKNSKSVASTQSWGTHNTKAPIWFRGDRAEGSRQEGIAKLIGNAVIIQDQTTLESDEAILKGTPGKDVLLGNRTNSLKEAIAFGHVRILKKNPAGGPELHATGDKATLDMVARTLTLEGDAKIWQGDEYVQAETILMNLATGEVTLTQPQGTIDPRNRSSEGNVF